jgi:hypothetical protein
MASLACFCRVRLSFETQAIVGERIIHRAHLSGSHYRITANQDDGVFRFLLVFMNIAGATVGMKLPSVTTTLTILATIWCIAGVSAHGVAILAYPLAWFALCIFFLAFNKVFDLTQVGPAKSGVAKRPAMANRPAGVLVEEQVSAA